MKFTKLMFAAAFAFASSSAYAFHSGGVAECEGCHSMHNSFEGAGNVTLNDGSTAPLYQSGPYLLKAQDQSGACLNCHSAADTGTSGTGSYHIMTKNVSGVTGAVPVEYTPGGDFGWLKTTRSGAIRGNPVTWEGQRQGHSIVAVDFGLSQDTLARGTAPGGTYPDASLACSSCHDPHGKYRRLADSTTEVTTGLPIFNSGSYQNSKDPIAGVSAVGAYRLLAGVGYQPKSLQGNFAFTNRSPVAVAPSTYNRVEAKGTQTHVAYGSGMSEWCSNCHTSMLENSFTSGMGGLVHPAGNQAKLTPAIVANYNAYVTSGIMTNTDATKAYTSLVPFELGKTAALADVQSLKALAINTDTADQSASTTANVSCLSCHRAHASGFESMARYYLGNEFMTVADASNAAAYDTQADDKIKTAYPVPFQQAAYNGRPASDFGPYARNMCNKCHAKD